MSSADALQEMLFQMKDGKNTGCFLLFPKPGRKNRFLFTGSAGKGTCAVRRFLRAENCHGRFIQRIPYIFRYNIRRGFAEKKDWNRDSGGKSR